MAYVLIGISLALALIGAYTRTYQDDERRRLTPWGKLVGALLIVSAGLAIYQTHSDQKSHVKAQQAAERDREDLKRSLTQQRMIALGALSSTFGISHAPILVFSFDPKVGIESPEYGEAFAALEDFPAFGTRVRGYRVGLYLSEERSFEYSSGDIPKSDVWAHTMEYGPDPTPMGMGHVFMTSEYKALDEVVLDFRPDRTVGQLTIWATHVFSPADVKKLVHRLQTDADIWVQVNIERPSSKLAYAHLRIPVKAVFKSPASNMVVLDLVVGDAELTAYDYGL